MPNNKISNRPVVTANLTKKKGADGNFLNIYRIRVYADESVVSDITQWTNAKGNKPFVHSDSSNAFEFDVPANKLDNFVNSRGFKAMIVILNDNGFKYDTNDFTRDVNVYGNNSVKADDNIDMSQDKLMNDMLDHFEGKINDPMVNQILSQMHIFDPNTGEFKPMFNLLKNNIKSSKNILLICAQWRNAGKAGVPQYVATAKQWRDDFNRYIVPGALSMAMSTPDDQQQEDVDKILNDYGLDRTQHYRNSHVTHTINSMYVDNGPVSDFHGKYVYDISDTEVIPGAEDTFNEHVGLASNLWADQYNQKAIDVNATPEQEEENKQQLKSAGFDEIQTNVDKIKSALEDYAQQNPSLSSAIKSNIEKGDIANAVRAYFETQTYIDREKVPQIKNAILNMCVFSVLNHYGIAPMEMLKAFRDARQYLSSNNNIPKSARVKFMPFYADFVNMVETNAKNKTMQEARKIRNDFTKMWNKIVEIRNRNTDEKVW